MLKKEHRKKDNLNTFSNYIKLFILFVLTIFLVLFIRNLYLNKQNYKLKIPVISETIQQEINHNEVYNFVRENPNAVIYIGAVSDSNCRTFESDFNQIIKDKKLEDSIVYLNLENIKGIQAFFKEFNKFYNSTLKSYPSIIVFRNGKIESLLEISLEDDYSPSKISQFLDQHQVSS